MTTSNGDPAAVAVAGGGEISDRELSALDVLLDGDIDKVMAHLDRSKRRPRTAS
jgi:hypothetical protein